MSKDDDLNSPAYDKAVRKALSEKITVTQGGKQRKMTKEAAMIERRTASALAGNTHAQRQALADIRRIEDREMEARSQRADLYRRMKAQKKRKEQDGPVAV